MPLIEPLPTDSNPDLEEFFSFFLGPLGFVPNSMVLAVGISGACWLLVITSSYGNSPPSRHWPPTNGVLATLRTGPSPQRIGPTTLLMSVVATASVTA